MGCMQAIYHTHSSASVNTFFAYLNVKQLNGTKLLGACEQRRPTSFKKKKKKGYGSTPKHAALMGQLPHFTISLQHCGEDKLPAVVCQRLFVGKMML